MLILYTPNFVLTAGCDGNSTYTTYYVFYKIVNIFIFIAGSVRTELCADSWMWSRQHLYNVLLRCSARISFSTLHFCHVIQTGFSSCDSTPLRRKIKKIKKWPGWIVGVAWGKVDGATKLINFIKNKHTGDDNDEKVLNSPNRIIFSFGFFLLRFAVKL